MQGEGLQLQLLRPLCDSPHGSMVKCFNVLMVLMVQWSGGSSKIGVSTVAETGSTVSWFIG
jgi:hypothetical protein